MNDDDPSEDEDADLKAPENAVPAANKKKDKATAKAMVTIGFPTLSLYCAAETVLRKHSVIHRIRRLRWKLRSH